MRVPRELLLGDLRARWVEYVLAGCLVGAVAGIVVVQRAIADSAESEVHDLAHRIGKNMLVVPGDADLVDFHGLQYGSEGMPDDYPKKLKSSSVSKHIRVMNARLLGNVEVNGEQLILVGEQGRAPPSAGAMSRAPEVSLGAEAARRLGVSPGDSAGVLKAQKGTVATMKRYGWVLYLVSLILVGGTVMALMSSQVRRSLREIGLLLSIGTSPTVVQLLLIGRASLIGLIGGGLGFLFGQLLTGRLSAGWLQLSVSPPVDLLLPLLALCVGVSAVAAEKVATSIRQRFPKLAVHVNAERGDEAELQTEATLAAHRHALYGLLATVVALGLVIAAFINARERRSELAMLFVIGADQATVAATVVARSAISSACAAAPLDSSWAS